MERAEAVELGRTTVVRLELPERPEEADGEE